MKLATIHIVRKGVKEGRDREREQQAPPPQNGDIM